MKKKVFSIIGVAAFAVAVAFNINASISNSAESDVNLANIEAVAFGEATIECNRTNCKGGKCHESSYNPSCPCKANGWQGWTCNNWSGI